MIRISARCWLRGFQGARHSDAAHGTLHFGDARQDGISHFANESRTSSRRFSCAGDLIPVMTGLAMRDANLGQKIVTMTWIGDGELKPAGSTEDLKSARKGSAERPLSY